LFFFSELIV
jgi:hypothetical protein